MKKNTKYKNKKVLVLGLGLSGISAINLLTKAGAEVFYHDDKEIKNSIGSNVNFENKSEMEKYSFFALVKSPGIELENWYVKTAKKLKIPIITELELASQFCDAKLIAITGTNGKTTVTRLIYEMIKRQMGEHVYMAGNIGIPFSDVVQQACSDDYIVCEASSFQLEFTYEFHPHIAVINNIFSHHLEHHHTFKNYVEAKSKIFTNQTLEDYLVVNGSQDASIANLIEINTNKVLFGLNLKSDQAIVYVKNNIIYYNNEEICTKNDLLIKGNHNIENFLAAATVAKILKVSNNKIKDVAKKFNGVEHRLEYIGEKQGCKFYNDSKSTDEEATIVALESIGSPIILLAGGMERGDKFTSLKNHLKNVKLVELFGENKKILQRVIESVGIKTKINDNLKEAFNDGLKQSEKGDTILLSPASASWDQFKNFEERGQEFKKIYRDVEE